MTPTIEWSGLFKSNKNKMAAILFGFQMVRLVHKADYSLCTGMDHSNTEPFKNRFKMFGFQMAFGFRCLIFEPHCTRLVQYSNGRLKSSIHMIMDCFI